MKTGRRTTTAPDPAIRCYLFYGADEAGSRALATELAAAFGPSERVDLSPAQLKADPTLLADEAASTSLFGGARYIRVDGAGDESLLAVEALLGASAAGCPVLLVAGALKKDARLVKRLIDAPQTRVTACHPPSAADLCRIAISLGEAVGVRFDGQIAERIAAASGGDRAVMAREIEKLADYSDASLEAPRGIDDAMLDAIGADYGEADLGRAVDALCSGDARALEHGLARLSADGQDGVPLVRAMLRRLLAMASARAEMDRGAPAQAAVDRGARFLFWRDKDSVARDLPRWPASRLAAAIDRLTALERGLKSSRGPGPVAVDRQLHAIARSVRR